MRRRRKKKNPAGLVLLAIAGVGSAIALGVALVMGKKKPTLLTATTGAQFQAQPTFTTGLPDATGLLVGDCIVAVQGQAGFVVGGDVPNGTNTMLKITSSAGVGATSVQAFSIDPRVTPAGSAFNVPTAAISGGGTCP